MVTFKGVSHNLWWSSQLPSVRHHPQNCCHACCRLLDRKVVLVRICFPLKNGYIVFSLLLWRYSMDQVFGPIQGPTLHVEGRVSWEYGRLFSCLVFFTTYWKGREPGTAPRSGWQSRQGQEKWLQPCCSRALVNPRIILFALLMFANCVPLHSTCQFFILCIWFIFLKFPF